MKMLISWLIVGGLLGVGLANSAIHSESSRVVPPSTLNEADSEVVTSFAISNPNNSSPEISSLLASLEKHDREQPQTRDPQTHIDLTEGLYVEPVTEQIHDQIAQFAFWPNDQTPTHLIVCIESSRQQIGLFGSGLAKLNPSVQRVTLSSGGSETILRGMDRCDVIERTPWGTILVGEEVIDGSAYEILSPLSVTNHTVTQREIGLIADSENRQSMFVAQRPSLPRMAWEGLAVLDNGVVLGIEEKPVSGSMNRNLGGGLFKFIPDHPYATDVIIKDLHDSPLVSGRVNAMLIFCPKVQESFENPYCDQGGIGWLSVSSQHASLEAFGLGAIGYASPEDLYLDEGYQGKGQRFCWTSVSSQGNAPAAQAHCAIDPDPLGEAFNVQGMFASKVWEGGEQFHSHDNTFLHPKTGLLFSLSHPSEAFLACEPDGVDPDFKLEGCVRILSVSPSLAKLQSVKFTKDGTSAYVVVQNRTEEPIPTIKTGTSYQVFMIRGFLDPANH